jgi:carbon-monoxide dehydrogenase large subunit
MPQYADRRRVARSSCGPACWQSAFSIAAYLLEVAKTILIGNLKILCEGCSGKSKPFEIVCGLYHHPQGMEGWIRNQYYDPPNLTFPSGAFYA